MARCKRVLVIDDEQLGRERMVEMLGSLGYEAQVAESGPEGLVNLGLHIDLVLLDTAMPGMDGFELCRKLRVDATYSDLPVLMMTDTAADRTRAADAGASDFLARPVDITELRARAATLLKLKEAQDDIQRSHIDFEEKILMRTADVHTALYELAAAHRKTEAAYLETIERLAIAAEYRDRDTAEHILRVSRYCEIISRSIGIPAEEAAIVARASALHDVGKIGISDTILLKPGSLTVDERRTMEQHTVIGADILSRSESPVLKAGEVIALAHHEKWDGTGYPYGLKGEAIPLYGRICAVADVFDAVTSTRPYKQALSCDDACICLLEGRGTQFDPMILDLFFGSMEEVMAVQGQFGEPAAEMFPRKVA